MKVHCSLMISDFRKSNNFIGRFPYSARFFYVKSSIGNDDGMGHWWNIIRGENRRTRSKIIASRIRLLQIQHGLTYARTRADAVKAQRLSPSECQLPKLT